MLIRSIQDEDCLDFPTNLLSSLEVVSSGSLEYAETFQRCVNLSAVVELDSFTLNLTGSASADIYLTRMAELSSGVPVSISYFRINLDRWWNNDGVFFTFSNDGEAISVGDVDILGTVQTYYSYVSSKNLLSPFIH